jgi:hypothetical protein
VLFMDTAIHDTAIQDTQYKIRKYREGLYAEEQYRNGIPISEMRNVPEKQY